MNPLSLRHSLAGNPSGSPIFSSTIRGVDGPLSVVDPRATRAMVSLMDMNAVMGGAASHYGGPAAFAELMSALHGYVFWEANKNNKQWFDLFHLVNDAGHCENGLYALKANYNQADLTIESLKKFRSFGSPLTGHGEAHLFPQGVQISNGPLGSALPQAQGLAMAESLSKQNRVTITSISDGACMEGEAREALAAIPGLAKRQQMGPFVLVISDNNTKLSGRIDKESFSMAPTFASLKDLGWKVLDLQDGHNLQACFDAFVAAIAEVRQNPSQPIVIHARTIKGIGTKKTAESASGGHGFPLKSPTELSAFLNEIYDGSYPVEFQSWIDEMIAHEKTLNQKTSGEKIQTGVSKAMIKAFDQGYPVVSITSDLPGSTGVAAFRKHAPQMSFDVGIAESNMISAAAGFSNIGYIPVVDTFAQFGVTKGALPLTMASLSQSPMICIFSHTGFQDAADGASHQALSYLAMTSSIPHVDVYCLSCSDEAEQLVFQAIQEFAQARNSGKIPHSKVFFLGRENFPQTYNPANQFELQKSQIILQDLKAEKNVTVVASGSMVHQAVMAAEELRTLGIGCTVIHPACHNKIDLKPIVDSLSKTQSRLVTVEDHQAIGGLGQMLAFDLAVAHVPVKLKALAVHGEFGQSAYSAQELYAHHRIDAKAIVQAARELCG